MTRYYWLHLRAPQDINGNPRRLYVVYAADIDLDSAARIVDVVDEEYMGKGALRTPGWPAMPPIELPSDFDITVAEYERLLAFGEKLPKRGRE